MWTEYYLFQLSHTLITLNLFVIISCTYIFNSRYNITESKILSSILFTLIIIIIVMIKLILWISTTLYTQYKLTYRYQIHINTRKCVLKPLQLNVIITIFVNNINIQLDNDTIIYNKLIFIYVTTVLYRQLCSLFINIHEYIVYDHNIYSMKAFHFSLP